MLNVGESTCALLSNLLTAAQTLEGVVARIVPTGDGLSLAMDKVHTNNQTCHHHGKPVLAVVRNVVALIDNEALDVVAMPQGPHPTLAPPGEETYESVESREAGGSRFPTPGNWTTM